MGLRVAAALVFLAALVSCAQLPAPAAGIEVEFELAGRIGMRYRDEATSGHLAWRHSELHDDLLISSPFGHGIAQIRRADDALTLSLADGRSFRARDAEALTSQVLGFRLPLAGLADWVVGRKSARLPISEEKRDARGRLMSLAQGGWRVEYLSYREDAPGAGLPTQLRLYYPSATDPEIELRVSVSDWRVLPRKASAP